jgi:WD40 repeat protein
LEVFDHKLLGYRTRLIQRITLLTIAAGIASAIILIIHRPAEGNPFCRGFWPSLRPELVMENAQLPIEPANLEPITITNLEQLERLAIVEVGQIGGGGFITFSPDSTIIAFYGPLIGISTLFAYTLLWDISYPSECFGNFPDYEDGEVLIAFSPHRDLLLTAISKPCIESGEIGCYYLRNMAHHNPIARFAFAEFMRFSDRTLMSYRNPGEEVHRVWDLETLRPPSDVQEGALVNARLFSPDGNLFVTTSADAISLWDTATQTRIAKLYGHENRPDRVYYLAFSPDSRWLASRDSFDVLIWNTTTAELELRLPYRWYPSFYPMYRDLGFTSDGERFAFQEAIWDIATGQTSIDLGERVFSGFSADRTFFAAVSIEPVDFLDIETGELVFTLDVGNRVLDVDFSPDRTLIAMVVETTPRNILGNYRFGRIELWGIPRKQ